MGMCVRNVVKTIVFFVILVFFGGCDAKDSILSSSGVYRTNARVNGIPMAECSFVTSGDSIHPYFDEPISNDPDVTALMVFLRNSRGEIAGGKVLYSLDGEALQDETVIQVGSLDGELTSFPIPPGLPYGRYTMVSQVMSGRDVLQKTEKVFFYLGNTVFSFENINAYLPGVAENPQLIPTGCVIMLEAKVNFDSHLDPYIVWYNGRKKISEGKFSDAANLLFWKAPEQSGFFSISAEIFPAGGYVNLAGYQKETSLIVSSKTVDMHLVSEDIPQLLHWYIFDGNLNDSSQINSNLNDSKPVTSAERSLKPVSGNSQWMSANGTYGLAAGYNSVIALPKVPVSSNGYETWQTLFRFKPINEGIIFSVQFGSSTDVSMNLKREGQYLVLTLFSPIDTVSQVLRMPEQNSFITAGVNFSILRGLLSAKINIMGDSVEQDELAVEPIRVETEPKDDFQIFLGDMAAGESANQNRMLLTALWDEFAVYNTPPMEIIAAQVRRY
ncbi:MAG: hypothetical protein LBQ93_06130 [Treponema sp.]|jgi:hypothetical protein|nr:hypothetical protein [Treponema sp.]